MDLRLFNLLKFMTAEKNLPFEEIDFRRPADYGIGKNLFFDKESMRKVYRYNFSRLISIANRHNVLLWVQNYHTKGWHHNEMVLNEVFDELNLEVVDQKSIFKCAKGLRMRSKDGWHPNRYGYYVIARLIYNKMHSYGFVKGKKIDLYSEIDSIKDYIEKMDTGYEYLADDDSVFLENEYMETLSRIGINVAPNEEGTDLFFKDIFEGKTRLY